MLNESASGTEVAATDDVVLVSDREFADQIIEGLGLEELADVAAKAAERLERLQKESRDNDMKMLNALAEKYGATITWPKAKKSVRPRPNARKKAPIRFIDPANTENQWSGRGRQPAWLQSYVAQGRKPSEFMVS